MGREERRFPVRLRSSRSPQAFHRSLPLPRRRPDGGAGGLDRPGRPGRRDAAEITVFESLGLAIEDLAAGVIAYEAARAAGTGAWVDFD